MWRIIWTTWNRVTSTWLSYGKTGMFEHGVYRPKIAFHREHDDNPWDTISFAPNLSYEPKYYNLIQFLVGGLEHFLFSHILGIMIPTDFHIFQRGWNHQPDFMWHVRKICWETSQKGSDFFFERRLAQVLLWHTLPTFGHSAGPGLAARGPTGLSLVTLVRNWFAPLYNYNYPLVMTNIAMV